MAALFNVTYAGPEEDRAAFSEYYAAKFPNTDPADFINGVYSIHAQSREQWMEIEEFPPYEFAVEDGKVLFYTAFANGKGYADCFADNGRENYPQFNTKRNQVVTLELAINLCRETNGESPLPYNKGEIADISAYMAFVARGKKINTVIQNEPAEAAYEKGKEFYYSKRGQLNFACMDCHISSVGMRIRAETLSPSLGHTSHFPAYRSAQGGMGTLHRRFAGCNIQVRAKPLEAQSEAYRNLEYFLSYMGNGLDLNGPGARK
jgi:sulfur-oxidizing protein SoxA